MGIEFWSDQDNTLPVDITQDIFTGSFKFGKRLIPMDISISDFAVNVINARVEFAAMADLPNSGKYDIDQLSGADKFRLIQGSVRVSQEVTI